jgi:hypothetical protein
MKKHLLLLLVLPALSLALSAQNAVFEDDFESYSDGTDLTSVEYKVWEGVATVVDDTVQTDQSPAYGGHKYVKCVPGNNNFYLRRNITLEEGKTYTFELVTRSPAGKNHKIAIKVGDRTITSSLVNHKTWNKVSVEVTVGSGETSAVAYLYSWPISRVDVDDFKVYEGTATRISKNEISKFNVYPNPTHGMVRLTGDKAIDSYVVYNSMGEVVKNISSVNQTQALVDLTGVTKGLFLIKITDVEGGEHIVKTLVK